MEWFKKHADTALIIGSIAGSMIWMNGKFKDIEKDIAVMKAVMVMQKILPAELATSKKVL